MAATPTSIPNQSERVGKSTIGTYMAPSAVPVRGITIEADSGVFGGGSAVFSPANTNTSVSWIASNSYWDAIGDNYTIEAWVNVRAGADARIAKLIESIAHAESIAEAEMSLSLLLKSISISEAEVTADLHAVTTILRVIEDDISHVSSDRYIVHLDTLREAYNTAHYVNISHVTVDIDVEHTTLL